MARKYSPKALKTVEGAMRKYKRGELKSGPEGKGGKVKSRKQAVAIGLSEARRKGATVPAATTRKKKTTKKAVVRKTAGRKAPKKAMKKG